MMKKPPQIPKYFTMPEWSIIAGMTLCILGYFACPFVYQQVKSFVASGLMVEIRTLGDKLAGVNNQLADSQNKLLRTEAERDNAIEEKDTAVKDKIQAESERDTAIKARDTAIADRTVAIKDKEKIEKELEELKVLFVDNTPSDPVVEPPKNNPEAISPTPTPMSLPVNDWKEKYDELKKTYTQEVSKLQREKWTLQDEVNRLKDEVKKLKGN